MSHEPQAVDVNELLERIRRSEHEVKALRLESDQARAMLNKAEVALSNLRDEFTRAVAPMLDYAALSRNHVTKSRGWLIQNMNQHEA